MMFKTTFTLTAVAAALLVSAQAKAADSTATTMSTSQDFKTLTTEAPAKAPAAQTTTTVKTSTLNTTTQKKPAVKGTGAHIVPDTTSVAPVAKIAGPEKPDQGYSNPAAYNVVNDQNKPVTQDWSKPKSWRIGYKNKNRAPANE